MTDPVFILLYIFVFPGFFFLFVYALFLSYLDRKIAARMQQRVGPPFYQPFADFIKMLGKEVINPDGVDWRVFDAIPLVALAAVMTAFLYVPVIGASPLAFPGDLVVVLYLMALPTIALFLLGWLSRNIFSAIGGIRAVTQLFIYEVPFFLALLTPAIMAGELVDLGDCRLAAAQPLARVPPAHRFYRCIDRAPGKTGEDALRYPRGGDRDRCRALDRADRAQAGPHAPDHGSIARGRQCPDRGPVPWRPPAPVDPLTPVAERGSLVLPSSLSRPLPSSSFSPRLR